MNNLIALLIASGAAYVYFGQDKAIEATPGMVAEYRRVGVVSAPDDGQRLSNVSPQHGSASVKQKNVRSRAVL